jgi:hypothetical protein
MRNMAEQSGRGCFEGFMRPASMLLAFAAILFAHRAALSQSAIGGTSPTTPKRSAEYRAEAARAPGVAADHPLLPVLDDAHEWLDHVRRTVRDSRCRVVKRERIDGVLQDYYYIDMWVREPVPGRSPLSVFMEFLGPSPVEGRRILFVEGRNEGKILVRKGGKRFDYVVTKVDPDSESGRGESQYTITQSGFVSLVGDIVATLERHIKADPSGRNTTVERPQGAKLDGRACHVVRITHPEKQDNLDFHVGTYFFDVELGVPCRTEKLDWPSRAGADLPVIAEFNYTKFQLNVGISDRTFDPQILRARR